MSLYYLTLLNTLFLLWTLISISFCTRRTVESVARLAFEHGARVNALANCREPKPQLIYFDDPTKVYLPRATLLHRCSDLTGCCPHSTQTCQPLETQIVDLYFYTVSLKKSALRNVIQEQNIDKISFTNHTKCGCNTKKGFAVNNNLFPQQEL